MPHIKNTYRYKDVLEVERVHAGRLGKGGEKEKRRRPTPEEMAKINERNAERTLRRLIHANFDPGDLWVTLTYRREERPTPGEAKRNLRNYLARVKKLWRKAGTELKYIVVTEYMAKAIHHHLILNELPGENGYKLAARTWKAGGTNCKPLYDEGGYQRLAEYIVKETNKHFRDPGNPSKCRYSCSRNLVRPPKKTKILKSDSWPEEPRVPKGYYLEKDSLHNGINRLGYRYQYYRLIKIRASGRGGGERQCTR